MNDIHDMADTSIPLVPEDITPVHTQKSPEHFPGMIYVNPNTKKHVLMPINGPEEYAQKIWEILAINIAYTGYTDGPSVDRAVHDIQWLLGSFSASTLHILAYTPVVSCTPQHVEKIKCMAIELLRSME